MSSKRTATKSKEIIGTANQKPLHVQYAELVRLRKPVHEAVAQSAKETQNNTAHC